MRRMSIFTGILVGVLTSLPIMALGYLGNLAVGLPFLPFDLFDWVTRLLPGGLVTFSIDQMVRFIRSLQLGPTASTAKLIEQGISIVLFLLFGALVGGAITALGRRRPQQAVRIGFIIGAVALAFFVLVEAMLNFLQIGVLLSVVWMAFLLLGWGGVLGRWVQIEALPEVGGEPASLARRRFLYLLGGGSLAIFLGSLGLARLVRPAAGSVGVKPVPITGGPLLSLAEKTSGPAASPPLAQLEKRAPIVPGTRAEITPLANFYRIDINTGVPTTDIQTWRLSVDGLVDHPLQLSLDELRAMPAVSQMVTLSCISNEVGGDLISTGMFTGVPLKTVLDQAGLKPGAAFFNINSFDNFYESLGLPEAMDERTLLVYSMDGQDLPPEHGYPLRIFIPNHFGMKQPKWISSIHVASEKGAGYWVDRGWSDTAIPETTSVIDTVDQNAVDARKQTVPLGGIAYAGARGIQRVEVSMDGGAWMPAELRDPALGPLTWVQWRIDFPYQSGRHTFSVRAVDGDGHLQDARITPPSPNGATGIDSLTVEL